MFKLLICLPLLVVFVKYNDGKSFKRGPLTYNSLESDDDLPWPNKWFPHPPNYHNDNVKNKTVNVAATLKDKEEALTDDQKNSSGKWSGLWFPQPPNYKKNVKTPSKIVKLKENIHKEYECDNGKDNLIADFDPEDKRHSYKYLCLGKRSDYAPNLNTSALIQEHLIPAAYEPPVKCLNESIDYTELIPTFGAYRPLAPKFGTYRYLPPQRWLHSLADGGLVLLYHPCAFPGQVEQLQNTLKGCLYRHIITPSQRLTPQRPLALVAWGKSLQMSVVDDGIVVKFIKDNAKLGFRQKQQKLKLSAKQYDANLLTEAHLVTDEQDTEICGYKEMR